MLPLHWEENWLIQADSNFCHMHSCFICAPVEVDEFRATDVHSNLSQTMETYKINKQWRIKKWGSIGMHRFQEGDKEKKNNNNGISNQQNLQIKGGLKLRWLVFVRN